MLHEFLPANRKQLVTRCREKAANRLDIIEVACVAYYGETFFTSRKFDRDIKVNFAVEGKRYGGFSA